jgi:hypothetical protein
MTTDRHEHHVVYNLMMAALWCPGCGEYFMSDEWMESVGIRI